MKKISNWVFGSFFRTMGRFFFFLFFGFLLATILSKSEIKITDLLGIETIKASEVQQAWVTNIQDSNGNWSDSQFLGSWYVQRWASTGTQQQGGANLVPQISLPRHGDIYINGYIESDYNILGNSEYLYCNYYANDYCHAWNTTSGHSIQLQLWLNSYGNQCKIEWNNSGVNIGNNYKLFFNATCQTQDRTIGTFYYYFNISLNENQSTQRDYRLGISRSWKYEITASNATENQSEQQAEQHNETMNFFNNENTTQAESEANNFFENFTSQDNGGISSIITAPLSAISGLASATCSPITLPIPYLDNKQLVLPCMSAIYIEHFGAFFSLYQTIIFGVVAYRMLVSIFMMIQGFKNPDDDKIEVVDL